MRSIRDSWRGFRFAALLALITALLLGGELAHDHSSLDSPDVCATCSVKVHTAAVVVAAPVTAEAPELEQRFVTRDPLRPSRDERPILRSRAPPLFS